MLLGPSVDIICACSQGAGEYEWGGPFGSKQGRLDGRRGRQEEEEGMLCHQLRKGPAIHIHSNEEEYPSKCVHIQFMTDKLLINSFLVPAL